MSEAKLGKKNHNWGKKNSEETRKKKSESNKGQKRSEETRQRQSEAAKKRGPCTAEVRYKISQTMKGRPSNTKDKKLKPLSDEHRYKISEAAKIFNIKKMKSCQCIETGECFKSVNDAARTMGLDAGNISLQLRGKRKTVKGFTFKYI